MYYLSIIGPDIHQGPILSLFNLKRELFGHLLALENICIVTLD